MIEMYQTITYEYYEFVEEFFDNIDPDNPEFPKNFNPLKIIRFDEERYFYPMNVWIREFSDYDVPDKLLLGVEHFVESPVESPLITWIIKNADADWIYCFRDEKNIPDYLYPYINIYQGKERNHPDISALMCWIMFMDGDIPELLWTEYDVFRRSTYNYLPIDWDLAIDNPLGTWLVYRRHQSIDDRLIHLLPSLMEYQTDAHATIIHYIRSTHTYPFPDIVMEKVEECIIENCAQTISDRIDGYYDSRWSLLCNWKEYRPNEPVPPILYKEKHIWQRIVQKFYGTMGLFEWLWIPGMLSDDNVEKLMRKFPENRWSDMLFEYVESLPYHHEYH